MEQGQGIGFDPTTSLPTGGDVAVKEDPPFFIDAFSGCGGLSLGLLRAGWMGLFAIEKDSFAFQSYRHNLVGGRYASRYKWPSWLPQSNLCIEQLLAEQHENLSALRGKVALLAGGPPCQGFSSAGRRDVDDPRNGLMKAYLRLVELVDPKFVLIENVKGMTVEFQKANQAQGVNYSRILIDALSERYKVFSEVVDVSHFGVPQARKRFIVIGVRHDVVCDTENMPALLDQARRKFLADKKLTIPVAAISALSDLEVSRNGVHDCVESKGFKAISYVGPRTRYQRLMRHEAGEWPTDTRLARHKKAIVKRFRSIIRVCEKQGRLNVSIGKALREKYGLKKHALRVLDPRSAAPTITSMPDDLLHYFEPRTLTVRENARLQSFPDWFQFQGKYTSGGERRRKEVPRFTQVANAVPPFLAEVIGAALLDIA